MNMHRTRNHQVPLHVLLTLAALSQFSSLAAAQQEASDATSSDAPSDASAGDGTGAPVEGSMGLSADLSLDSDDEVASGDAGDAGGLVLGGKVGGGLSFSDLSAHPSFAIELGYRFGAMDGAFGAVLDVAYSVPTAEGDQEDPRVPGGSYQWELWQKELVLQPTFIFRLTTLTDAIVPYVGIGPRFYMLQTVVRGSADGVAFPRSIENSTKIGFGLPLGVEYELGPGYLFGEILFQWGPLDHDITGDSNLGTGTLWLGYRAIL